MRAMDVAVEPMEASRSRRGDEQSSRAEESNEQWSKRTEEIAVGQVEASRSWCCDEWSGDRRQAGRGVEVAWSREREYLLRGMFELSISSSLDLYRIDADGSSSSTYSSAAAEDSPARVTALRVVELLAQICTYRQCNPRRLKERSRL